MRIQIRQHKKTVLSYSHMGKSRRIDSCIIEDINDITPTLISLGRMKQGYFHIFMVEDTKVVDEVISIA